MTASISGMFNTILFGILAIQERDGDDDYLRDIYLQITYISFFCNLIPIVVVWLYMRYIDDIHFAKTELARDKQIMKKYMKLNPNVQGNETLTTSYKSDNDST